MVALVFEQRLEEGASFFALRAWCLGWRQQEGAALSAGMATPSVHTIRRASVIYLFCRPNVKRGSTVQMIRPDGFPLLPP